MDYRKGGRGSPGTGGSDGCVNFEDPNNADIPDCLVWTDLAGIYNKWCDRISMADFIVVAAEAVAGSLSPDYNANHKFNTDTLLTRFKQQFEFGRKSMDECPQEAHMTVNVANGCDDLQKIYVDNIFKSKGWGKQKAWDLTAALSGAHTMGNPLSENSGYDGRWTTPVNAGIFDNDYYKNIIKHGWGPKHNIDGELNHDLWELIDLSPVSDKKRQFMLNTDLCLFYQDNIAHSKCMAEEHDGLTRNRRFCKQFEKKGSFLNARSSSCCAWTQFQVLWEKGITDGDEYCGEPVDKLLGPWDENLALDNDINSKEVFRTKCCVYEPTSTHGDCDTFFQPRGPAMKAILNYATSNELFYEAYLEAWKVATGNGFDLKKLL